MHSRTVMDKGETSVCTMQSRGTSVSLQMKEIIGAQGNIIMMHSHDAPSLFLQEILK